MGLWRESLLASHDLVEVHQYFGQIGLVYLYMVTDKRKQRD